MTYSGKELLATILAFVKKARSQQELCTINNDALCDNGEIFYYNSNDGTVFDWRENHKTCEFYIFHKSTERGFIKFYVYENGTIGGWGFPENGYGNSVDLATVTIGKAKAYAFFKLMNKIADNECNYNSKLSDLDFNVEIEIEDEEIHSAIAEVRNRRNLTQKDLAELMGITQSAVSDRETGRYKIQNISFGMAARFAEVLNCQIEDLIDFYKPTL